MGYPALMPSACLPPSLPSPPTTLPPQYDISSAHTSTFGSGLVYTTTANKFPSLTSHALNHGIVAVDMPTSVHAKYNPTGLGIGLDPNGYMIGGSLSGALQGQDIVRAVSSVSVHPARVGRDDGGMNDGGEGEGGGGGREGGGRKIQRRVRKRSYNQATQSPASGMQAMVASCEIISHYCLI